MVKRFSERYSPIGSLAAEGVRNQLGRPGFEMLEVLVREAVQNCWDAKRKDSPSIHVRIERQTLDGSRFASCRDHLFVDPPPGLPLADEIHPGVEILTFADFGTDGLGGPVYANEPGEPRDFVDFIRNIGQPPDKKFGGGSFGYGKAAFYLVSRAKTVFVDTLCKVDGRLERRFIGYGLGDHFEKGGTRYTGRHWWGEVDDDGLVAPLYDDEAADAAQLLGLPDRATEDDLGTTVTVLAPDIAEFDKGRGAMEFVAEALLWNFWPHMLPGPDNEDPSMTFELADFGEKVYIPAPRSHPRIGAFVEAFEVLRGNVPPIEGVVLERTISAQRPKLDLGRIAIARQKVTSIPGHGGQLLKGERQMMESVNHIALMRKAELVVKYFEGRPPIEGTLGYAGVFRASDEEEVDEAFRQSEPPTHDDWVADALSARRQKTIVNVALREIRNLCKEMAGEGTQTRFEADGGGFPLGEFSDALGTLMVDVPGTGARRNGSSSGKENGRGKVPGQNDEGWVRGKTGDSAQGHGGTGGAGDGAGGPPPMVRPIGEGRLRLGDRGERLVVYSIEARSNGHTVRFIPEIQIMSNDGMQVEKEPPVGAQKPTVAAWRKREGGTYPGPGVVTLAPEDADGIWDVEIEVHDDAVIRLNVTLEAA